MKRTPHIHGPVRQRGAALILALWGVALGALMAGSVLVLSGNLATRTAVLQERVQAGAVLDGALERLILALVTPEERKRLPLDGSRVHTRLLGHEVVVTAALEQARMDINAATPELIAALLMANAVTEERAETIAARIIAGRPWAHPAALAGLEGMTPDLLAALLPDLTVWTGAAQIDPWAASPVMLAAATGRSPLALAGFLAARSEARSTRPDLPEGLPGAMLGRSDGRIWRISAALTLPGGAVMRREAVLRLTGQRAMSGEAWMVLEWRE